MTLPAAVQWGLLAAILLAGILLERRVKGTTPLVSVPRWAQVLLGGLALGGPFVLLSSGVLPATAVDETIVAIALSAALWVAAMTVVGVGSATGKTC